jgi:hypothetical protein
MEESKQRLLDDFHKESDSSKTPFFNFNEEENGLHFEGNK